jgi:hypothetical protein
MEKPTKKERKKRIKDQNAEAKKQPRRSPDPKTPEEFDRQMQGFMMIAFGMLKVVGIDPAKWIEEAQADEFPEELDT